MTFSDGTRVDAGDVLATFVAQWDATRTDPRAPPTAGAFAAWDELFGGAARAAAADAAAGPPT